ncbi:MAG TPA: nucleotide exchange factor GrpE [Candidatus Cryosericum sp.]|nr:nucleotide exchange factor GrpE [Candidatus Cryosericum sp.]
MSARGARAKSGHGKATAKVVPLEIPSADDEIEILEVEGINETERPTIVVPAEIRAAVPAEPAGPSQADLEEAVREKERYHDLWLRQQAEFDNFKKRADRDLERQRANAAADVFRRLLPVLDNLERALENSAGDDPLRQGVSLIHQQMLDTLAKEGLETIAAKGERFDPSRHEAVEMVDAEGREEGVILEVVRKGFMHKDRLIRPALVKVSSGRGAAGPARSAQSTDGD